MDEKLMVVINCGSQGMHKFKTEGRTILEKKYFPPNTPVECSVEMGEALLKKYNDPRKAIFFRNPADKKHRAEIQTRLIPHDGPVRKKSAVSDDDLAGIQD